MSTRPISSVAIAGGGIVAWSAAAAIRRQLPSIRATVVPIAIPPEALADRLGCTLPSIIDFHHDLGLTEADTVVAAASGFRLGTRFEGWSSERPGYIHAYGEYGRNLAATAFHQHWLRANGTDEAAKFDEFSLGAAMAAADRFLPPEQTPSSRVTNYAYGLHIDPLRYLEMIRAFALHLGAEERGASIADVRLRGDGFVDSLVLDDGKEVVADLFIDAGGPQAPIRGKVDNSREDWGLHFAVNRLVLADEPSSDEPSVLDHARAIESGWTWLATSPVRRSSGFAYSSAHLDDASANDLLGGGETLVLGPSRLTNPWVRNCVAIGDSAVTIEPLEWTNLHLAHSAIDRLVAMMPDADCNPTELWDYNRQTNAELDRARDFVLLHYAVSNRPEPFWQDASSRPLPASLEHTLLQWRERGRLPFFEEETFTRDSWAAVLIGQGVIPRRIDPLLTSVPERESACSMEQLRNAIQSAVTRAPTQGIYLRNLSLQGTR
jgi:tryptophan halogenase